MIDFGIDCSNDEREICCTMSEKKTRVKPKPATVKKVDKATLEMKKDLAKILFTREKLEQKVIADRVGVSEKTVSSWVNDGNWRKERQLLLISKQDQLNSFYSQLEKLNEQIESKDGIPDSKQADIQIKLSNSIRNMETEDIVIADCVSVGMKFMKHIQVIGTLEQVKEFAELWNSFLQNEIKKR